MSTNRTLPCGSTLTALALAITVPSAIAQETDDGSTSAGVLEEVLVTAQKREQRIQDVPLSIQALSGDELEKAGISTLNEMVTFVPGASEESAFSRSQRRYQIRGIYQSQGDPTVGYYVDEAAFFFFGGTFAPQTRGYDLDRVEVLRGPQSTLYGNGAMGGVVRLMPTQPDLEEFGFSARAGYSDTSGGESGDYQDASINIPLMEDKLGLRVSGSRNKVGGYMESAAGDQDIDGSEATDVRAILLAKPSDELTLKLTYTFADADEDASSLLLSTEPPIAVSSPGDTAESRTEIINGFISYDFDSFTISSSFTGIDFEREQNYSLPFPGAPNDRLTLAVGNEAEGFNNETRISSTGDGPFQWIGGFFYSDSEFDLEQTSNLPVLVPTTVQNFSSESLSVFGEVSYEFMDGKLVPLIGLRYFTDDRETSTDLIGVGQISSLDETFDSVNPRFNVSYYPNEAQTYFVNVAKGFRSGWFNNPAICEFLRVGGIPCEDAVDSDELWSYELGYKYAPSDSGLFLDLALYYQDWQDNRQPLQFAGVFQEIVVGDAELYGLDIGIGYVPASIPNLSLNFTGNINSSEFSSVDSAVSAATGGKSGDRLPFVPEWTASASASYDWQIGSTGWAGAAYLSYSHIAPQRGLFGGTMPEGDSRQLMRARLGVSKGGVSISLFGANLLDEDGIIYSQTPTVGITQFTQDYPRTVGLEVGFDFY